MQQLPLAPSLFPPKVSTWCMCALQCMYTHQVLHGYLHMAICMLSRLLSKRPRSAAVRQGSALLHSAGLHEEQTICLPLRICIAGVVHRLHALLRTSSVA